MLLLPIFIDMTCIHDLTVDLAKASKSVNEILVTIEAAYPGKGLLQSFQKEWVGVTATNTQEDFARAREKWF